MILQLRKTVKDRIVTTLVNQTVKQQTAINLIPSLFVPMKASLLQCDYKFNSYNLIMIMILNSYYVAFAHNLSTH